MDVKITFLHGPLEEEIYMSQPKGFKIGNPDEVCLLKKAPNGLKRKVEINKLKLQLNIEFEIKDLGKVKRILSIEIERTELGIIKLHQKKRIGRTQKNEEEEEEEKGAQDLLDSDTILVKKNRVKTTRLFYYGLKDTTATYTTNFLNLIPIVTFVVSVIIRLERLRLGSKEGKVKTIGALLCVSGALLTALYKGNEFFISNHHSDHHSPIIITPHHHWTRGTIMLVASTLAYSSWFIVQVKLQKQLPFVYLSTMLTCILSSFQSVILGLCLNTDSIAWSLGWNLQLVTIIYSGILATAVNLCLLSWAISVQGPTYPPTFNPLALIFVAFLIF
ncbi:WAT1-related protein At1g25270-like [Cannabis sativa]|uniref:WAT1-related protein At1g25270-like n=1 Tax=Cannabis sativa TaxID=3483 RepID=UPI0029CA1973|nr:WAT1-related protein At1g25270-like [Cannabis sativa]